MIHTCALETPIAPSYFRNNRSTRQKSLRCFPQCCVRGHVAGGFCGQSLRARVLVCDPCAPTNIPGASATALPSGEVVREYSTFSDGQGVVNNTYHNYAPLRSMAAAHTHSDAAQQQQQQQQSASLTQTQTHAHAAQESASSSHSHSHSSANNANTRFDMNEYLFVCELRPLKKPQLSAQHTLHRQELMNAIRTKLDTSRAQANAQSGGKELFLGEVTVRSTAGPLVELSLVFNAQHHSWDYSWRSNRWSATNEQHVVDIVVLRYSPTLPNELLVSSCYTSSPFYIISSHKKPGQRLASSDMEVLCASQLLSGLAELSRATAAAMAAVSKGTTTSMTASSSSLSARERERERVREIERERAAQREAERESEEEEDEEEEEAEVFTGAHSGFDPCSDSESDRDRERDREGDRHAQREKSSSSSAKRATATVTEESAASILSHSLSAAPMPVSMSHSQSLFDQLEREREEAERERERERASIAEGAETLMSLLSRSHNTQPQLSQPQPQLQQQPSVQPESAKKKRRETREGSPAKRKRTRPTGTVAPASANNTAAGTAAVAEGQRQQQTELDREREDTLGLDHALMRYRPPSAMLASYSSAVLPAPVPSTTTATALSSSSSSSSAQQYAPAVAYNNAAAPMATSSALSPLLPMSAATGFSVSSLDQLLRGHTSVPVPVPVPVQRERGARDGGAATVQLPASLSSPSAHGVSNTQLVFLPSRNY